MNFTIRFLLVLSSASGARLALADEARPSVRLLRVPEGGIQPQVLVDAKGELHRLHYRGPAQGGDLYYARSKDGGETFTKALRVNSEPGSAIAAGTIRGGQIAVGASGRPQVIWNGAKALGPEGAPVWFSRLDDAGKRFEPQRNLRTRTRHLDGGASIAADAKGNVYAVWHSNDVKGPAGEAHRAVWVAASRDEGKTFAEERRVNLDDTGACGCCGLRAFADREGAIYILYRAATKVIGRDMRLLRSTDRGQTFRSSLAGAWKVPQCVMSLASFTEGPGQRVAGAWETEGRVHFGSLDAKAGTLRRQGKDTGTEAPRKHPSIAVNARGDVLLAWSEGTGWKRGGALAWQVYDKSGLPIAGQAGRVEDLPVWSFPAAAWTPKGFVIFH